ncbi:hypothetical protein ACE38V_13490 [Cytobacillus sp. Hz8]|uniref:hypothetical protein n=1 Tax=Cytobacillus sp. Hz8 TaxID=3347168 RepID=UPI0035DD7E9B
MKNRATFYILGISSFNQIYLIEKKIKDLCGIISCKGSMPKGKLQVEFKPSIVSDIEIINKIEDQGFSVVKKIQREYYREIYN